MVTTDSRVTGGKSLWADYRMLFAKMLLISVVLSSAIAVIYVSHLNRRLFNEYQMMLQVRDRMDVEWGQLLLEQSAFAAHARIEKIALNRIGMRAPSAQEIIMVQH